MWLAIIITDHGNHKNKLHVAIGWSVVIIGAFFWPLTGLVLGLIVLMMILMRYYIIGFFRSILVIIVLFFLQLGLAILMEAMFMTETT